MIEYTYLGDGRGFVFSADWQLCRGCDGRPLNTLPSNETPILTFVTVIAFMSGAFSSDTIKADAPHEAVQHDTQVSVVRIVDNAALAPQKHVSVEEYVRSYFDDAPVMARVAWCESKFEHTDDNGNVLRGEVTPADVGVMQINTRYHGKRAEELGYDLHTLDGNLGYARHLYEKSGVTPWSASQHCWNSSNRVAQR